MEHAEHVHSLVKKSAEAKDSNHAMHFAQAALNAANALSVIENTKRENAA